MSFRRAAFLRALLLATGLALAACAAPGPSASDPTGAPGGRDGAAASSAASLPGQAEETEQRRRARIRLELASSYYQQGSYAVALDELRQALSVDPDYASAYGLLALIHFDLGDRVRAEDSFQRALRLAPDDSEIQNNYGWYLCQTQRPRESLEHFQRALRNPLYATPARPLHNAGICALRMGDEKAAEGFFLRSFQVDPSNPVAAYHLGELFLKRGEIERARFYAQRLLSTYEPSAEMLWLALRVERRAGRADGEASLAAQLRRRYPDSREAGLLANGNYGD